MSTIGTPVNACNGTHRLQLAPDLAGSPRQRFYELRHSAASLLFAAGEHPRVVIGLFGHSDIVLTKNTHCDVMPAALENAAGRMDVVIDHVDDSNAG